MPTSNPSPEPHAELASEQDDLVTVGTFPDLASAGLARSALEAAGLTAILRGGNANGLIPFAFESQIQVRAAEEAAALQILAGTEEHPATEAEVLAAEEAEATDSPQD